MTFNIIISTTRRCSLVMSRIFKYNHLESFLKPSSPAVTVSRRNLSYLKQEPLKEATTNNKMVVTAKTFIFKKHFDGAPKESDLELTEEELPALQQGEFLAEAVFVSVDPYMRPYSRSLQVGSTFLGSQVAKIIESKNKDYPVGKYVVGYFGWRSHTISKGETSSTLNMKPFIIPDFKGLPLSLALGVLGMPGNTAYFGFLELCKPQAGDTVVVTGAAGAVGSIVGQIAKLKGCTVIGVAGSDEKGKWLVDELKFDHFINYKKPGFEKNLASVSPKGIDCYFDNVGGEISSTITQKMNQFGRIAVCGAIAHYNDTSLAKVTSIYGTLVFQQLRMEGFIVNRWANRWSEGIEQNMKWIKEGKLKYRETVTEGFENTFKAFVSMLEGGNYGKAIIKV